MGVSGIATNTDRRLSMSTVVERESVAAAPRRMRLSTNDCRRLKSLLWSARRITMRDLGPIFRLEQGIESARVFPPERLPQDVVSINSRVCFLDETAGGTFEYTLVFPSEASVFEGRISVLSPVGSALLGRSIGERVPCRVPGGETILRVLALVSQPESSGQY
jgi:regulator of nucleoside diphosphate kinase